MTTEGPAPRRVADDDSPRRRQVFVFAGHMADAPGRARPRLPTAKMAAARERIAETLDALGAAPGDLALTQGAAGSDLVFAELALERGLRLELLLPLARDAFIARSILPVEDGEHWLARFLAVERRLPAGSIRDADAELGAIDTGGDPFVRGNAWLLDSALAEGDADVRFVCLWDGRGGDGPGGTRDMVAAVQRLGGEVTRIDASAL